jgi:hypothetical protein
LIGVGLEDFFKNITSGYLVIKQKVHMIYMFGDAAVAEVESLFPDGVATD